MRLSLCFIISWVLVIRPSLQHTPDTNENIDNGVDYFEGDILLTKVQREVMESDRKAQSESVQHAVYRFSELLWPGGVVPYEIDSDLYDSAVHAVMEAIEEYKNKTCITFRQKTAEDSDYVKFYQGFGCSSFVGRVGGMQEISLGRGCDKKGIVIHELFHALGRWHEQARPDRDMFVTINTENIKIGFENNFEIITERFATTQGVPYDFDSVMHYPSDAFSANGKPTIVPKDSSIDVNRLGQREELSSSDLAHVNALYCGNNGEWSEWSLWTTCSVTCNGGTRRRFRTCNGGTNCVGSNVQETTCNTEPCPLLPTWSEWTNWSKCSAACGGGRRNRVRTCLNGDMCKGASEEFEDCNQHTCTELLNSWSSWSECTHTCRGGFRYRLRLCVNSDNISSCLGETTQTEECNNDISCDIWSECSRSCGGGLQTDIVTQKTRACNIQPCHDEQCLEGLNHVGCYKLPFLREALIFAESNRDEEEEDPFNREEPVRKCAELARSVDHSHFAIALGLCYTGSDELVHLLTDQAESGLCTNGTGGYFGSSLIGDVYRIDNAIRFQISSERVEECGIDYCNDPSLIRSCNIHSGATTGIINRTSNVIILFLLLLLSVLLLQLLH